MRPVLGLVGLVLTIAFAACGSAPGLPDQGPCPTPVAALTDDSTGDAYRAAVAGGIEVIQEVDQHFRIAWDERRLRERGEFRADFAAYAHETECQLRVMETLDAPGGGALAELDAGLDKVIDEYLVALTAGRDAVETRNASAYGDWIKQIDALAVALGDRREQLLAGN